MKRIILILTLSCGIVSLIAQNAYKISWAVDAPIIGIGVASIGTGFYFNRKIRPLTPEQLPSYNRMQIRSFDRIATYKWDRESAHISDALMYTSWALPFSLLADPDIRKDYKEVGLIGIEVFMLNNGITLLTKSLSKRARPYVYNPDVPESYKLKKDALESFFSGHTSSSSAMTYMFATTYTYYHPKDKMLPMIWTVSAGLPLLTGIYRIKAGKHYPSDVIVGYLAGAFVGILVPSLHGKGIIK